MRGLAWGWWRLMWLRRKEEAGVGKITPVAGEKKKLEGCWVAVSHGVEAEDAGIHDREDGWNSGREEEQCWKCWKRLVFLLNLHFSFFPLNARNPLLFIRVKEGHLVIIGDQSWPLIKTGRILTIDSKSSSWAAKTWLLKVDRVSLFGQRHNCCRGNQQARIMLGYSIISDHHSGVLFVRFGGDTKH